MPDWLQLMADSLPTLLWAGLIFTIPLTLLSFTFGLALRPADRARASFRTRLAILRRTVLCLDFPWHTASRPAFS